MPPALRWLDDASEWSAPENNETIKVAAILLGGTYEIHLASFDSVSNLWSEQPKLFVFGCGSKEIHQASFDTNSDSWSLLPGVEMIPDDDGWSNAQYNETIRVVCKGNLLCVFARGNGEIHLASFNTIDNSWSTLPSTSSLTDECGWNGPEYYRTIDVVSAGEKLMVFGRGKSEILLASYDTTSNFWSLLHGFEMLPDDGVWNQPKYCPARTHW